MIKSIKELLHYTKELATLFPQIADEVEIKPTGVSATDINALQSDIQIPPIYGKCIEHLGLFGVSIGYFSLWPSFSHTGDLTESLRFANKTNDAWHQIAKTEALIAVARQEANVICVGKSGSTREDEVYLLETMSSSSIKIIEIAPNFELFLLLAGNLHFISMRFEENPEEGIKNMEQCTAAFHCSEEQKRFWRMQAREILL